MSGKNIIIIKIKNYVTTEAAKKSPLIFYKKNIIIIIERNIRR